MELNLKEYNELPYFDLMSNIPKGIPAIYIIIKNNIVVYVGTTCDLKNRCYSHRDKGDKVYYMEEENLSRQHMIECVYKFKYFNTLRITNFTYPKESLNVSIEDMQKELQKITF